MMAARFKDFSQMEQLGMSMSNADHTIDDGLEEALRENTNAYAAYYGWNFCGYVYFDGKQFACEVWTHNSPRETISADTLPKLMQEVCNEYGYD